jgi:pimeloyl-ACP methyl ester carboxylesterase
MSDNPRDARDRQRSSDDGIVVFVEQRIRTVLGWPSDVFSMDCVANNGDSEIPHTLIIFIPGNPGLVEWYLPVFKALLERLGSGYAVRGVANAGHSRSPELVDVEAQGNKANLSIPWTVKGQALHKMAFVDLVTRDSIKQREQHAIKLTGTGTKTAFGGGKSAILPPHLIFVSHSIGCHFTQRLCVWRPDLLSRTCMFLFLMPFIRMDAPAAQQTILNLAASHPGLIIRWHEAIMRVLKSLPRSVVDRLMRGTIREQAGRDVAVDLVRQPKFARNFFQLGLEEVRILPQTYDVSGLQILGEQCSVHILNAGNDHWSPESHMVDLLELRDQKRIPSTVSVQYEPSLRHDFVSHVDQIPVVVEFCVDRIGTQGHQVGTVATRFTSAAGARSRL